jgi:hypothetical protein
VVRPGHIHAPGIQHEPIDMTDGGVCAGRRMVPVSVVGTGFEEERT